MIAKFDDKPTPIHVGANLAAFLLIHVILQQLSQGTVKMQYKSILIQVCIKTLLTCTESKKTLAKTAAAALQAPLQ